MYFEIVMRFFFIIDNDNRENIYWFVYDFYSNYFLKYIIYDMCSRKL